MYVGCRFFKSHASPLLKNDSLLRSKFFNKGYKFSFSSTSVVSCYHKSHSSEYPATEQLPLPLNIKNLVSTEKLKFSPQRARDINGSFISCFTSLNYNNARSYAENPVDEVIEYYDCSGTVNLSSTMQTNVPFPFKSKGKPIHLNMPGGQWGQKEKYISEDLNNTHHTNIRQLNNTGGTNYDLGNKRKNKNVHIYFSSSESNFIKVFNAFNTCNTLNTYQLRTFSSMKDNAKNENVETKNEVPVLSRKEKLKAAVKDYGAVILVFHIGISLVSLGCFYVLVASGIDLSFIFKNFGVEDGAAAAGTAAHFIIAYSLHKSLAPVRISITLTAAPFAVKKLRKIGILKTPAPKSQ